MLPSNNDVLSLFMNYRNSKNETIREALTSTVNDVLSVWQKATISTTQKCNAVKKLFNLYDKWKMLKKSKGKKSNFSIAKENKWKENLCKLFDIAHDKANEIITISRSINWTYLN